MNRDEWESAILSAHATRRWPFTGKRGLIANALHDWLANQFGGSMGHETMQTVIEALNDYYYWVYTIGQPEYTLKENDNVPALPPEEAD